jgi:hypothetical protein
VGPRAGLDAVKQKIPSPHRESNPGRPARLKMLEEAEVANQQSEVVTESASRIYFQLSLHFRVQSAPGALLASGPIGNISHMDKAVGT